MNCYNVEQLLATRRDLDGEQARAVQTHLLSCDRCAAAWQREQRTTQILQALPTSQAQLSLQVAVNIRARLRRPPRRWKPQFAAALAVALCCLILVSAVAAQAYPAAVQQAVAQLGWKGFSHSQQLYLVGNKLIPDKNNPQGVPYGQLTVFNPATQQVTQQVGDSGDVVLAPDGLRMYIGSLVDVRAIDRQTQQEVWRVTLRSEAVSFVPAIPGASRIALSPDGRWLYVVDEENSHRALQIIDAATGQLQPHVIQLRDGINPRFITPRRGTQLYILNDYTIDVLNTQTQQIGRSLSVPDAWLGAGTIEGAMLSPDQHQLYVINSVFSLAVFDLAQGTLVEERALTAPARTADLAVFVAGSADGTRLVVGQNPLVDLGGYRDGAVVQPHTSVVGGMIVYDTRTWQPVQQIALDRPVETLAANTDGSVVYVVATPSPDDVAAVPSVLSDGSTIVAFDVASGQVRAEYKREREQILRLFVGP